MHFWGNFIGIFMSQILTFLGDRRVYCNTEEVIHLTQSTGSEKCMINAEMFRTCHTFFASCLYGIIIFAAIDCAFRLAWLLLGRLPRPPHYSFPTNKLLRLFFSFRNNSKGFSSTKIPPLIRVSALRGGQIFVSKVW